MSFQAYIDNVKAKTGKTPEDFAKLAAKNGSTKHGEIVTWLKRDFALGHGHATAIAAVVLKSGGVSLGPLESLITVGATSCAATVRRRSSLLS